MASTRNIAFKAGKEKASLKWYTGSIRALYYDHENVRKAYRELVKPYLHCGPELNTRRQVNKMVFDHIKEGRVTTMFDFVNLTVALRLTEIDETHIDEDTGEYIVSLIKAPLPEREKYTFWNVCWHMNHHCRQTYKCCYVQVVRPMGVNLALAYTGGEAYDRYDFFLDEMYERDREENKEARKKYGMKKRGEKDA